MSVTIEFIGIYMTYNKLQHVTPNKITKPLTNNTLPNKITNPQTPKPTINTGHTSNHKSKSILNITNNMIIIKTSNKHMSSMHPPTISKTPKKYMTSTLLP